MQLKDLYTGDRVTTVEGHVYTVLLGVHASTNNHKTTDVLVSQETDSREWIALSQYDQYLRIEGFSPDFDIVKIERPNYVYDIFYSYNGYTTIWER